MHERAAVEYDVTAERVVADLTRSDALPTVLTALVRMLADADADAVALGNAAWCWRNDTAVEARRIGQ
ncbi:hypothetical protein EEB14_07815 [Rhodococcus sp. WS4]|jgi:hypothetical protein|nr:hypothetical protein EEB14_07815 [Rhodococcus sp. WS4]